MQSVFAAALLDPALPPPQGLPAARFVVYRNNVLSSLTRALAAGFPACEAIVGTEFFAAMAQDFIRAQPPASPVLLEYGAGFGDFIAGFPPAGDLPYLADVARLEAAHTRAFHAADIDPLPPAAIGDIDPARLTELRLTLHPAVTILRSPHPLATIWAMNTGALPLQEIADWQAEDALVRRPALTVTVQRLLPGQAAFLLALQQGENVGAAVDAACRDANAFDPAAAFALLFGQGLVIHLEYAA
jgi:hypothetical protein